MIIHIPRQLINEDQVIWRYMDFVSFYSLFERRTLFFRRLDKYSDANEGTLPPRTIRDLKKLRLADGFETSEQVDEFIRKLSEDFERERSYTLSNSWLADEHENYAMWKIYLRGSNEGIAIKSTVRRLKKALALSGEKIFIGNVNYDFPSTKFFSQFEIATWKHPAYKHEREFRALMIGQHDRFRVDNLDIEQPRFDVGHEVKVDIADLVEEIYLSPFSGLWFYDMVESVIRSFAPKGFGTRIMASEINEK